MRKGGSHKRPLAESFSSENNQGPPDNPSKRRRVDTQEVQQTRSIATSGRRRRRRGARVPQVQVPTPTEEPTRGRKRQQEPLVEEPLVPETDENVDELAFLLKKARLRPSEFGFNFSISSFISQTVESVQVTLGQEEEEDGHGAVTSFTFVLPLHPRRDGGGGYEHDHDPGGHDHPAP